MEVRCQDCGHVYRVPRDIFEGGGEKVTLHCNGCGRPFQVLNPRVTTLRVERTQRKVPSVTGKVNFEGRELSLPEDQELSLRVLEGDETGTVYPVNKPRVTIGRANADISLNDRLASRLHCALEVSSQRVLIRDLDSTNGTLVNGKPIETAELAGGSTFRVGRYLFQLLITPKGA